MKSYSGRFLTYLFLIIVAFISFFPFWQMFVVSSVTEGQAYQFPPRVLPGDQFFINMERVFDTIPVFNAFLNTIILATTITFAQLFFCSLAAFALSRLNFKGRNFLFIFIIGTLMLPNVGPIPLYIVMAKFGLVNNLLAVILPGLVTAFGVFLLKQYIDSSVHPELIESAKVDGARNFQTYYRIVLPIIKPGLATLGVITFMFVWTDFVWPSIVLRTDDVLTIQLAVRQLQNSYNREAALIMNGVFLASVPLVFIFFLFSRQLIAGITEGSVKG